MDLTRWLLERTARFPKRLRHSLTERIEVVALGVLEDITTAGYGRDKTAPIRRAVDGVNRLRVLLRLAHELRVLSHGQYAFAAEALGDAGAQLHGWLRHADHRRPSPPA